MSSPLASVTATHPIINDRLPAHPRLFAQRDRWDSLRSTLTSADCDPALSAVYRALQREARKFLDEPVLTRELTGRRLLAVSRLALFRISVLAAVARLSGETLYLDRAVRELEAVTALSDWNPSHFLDVGEMALAVAIGYDWLYDDLSPELRHTIETALLDKAFRPTFSEESGPTWWIRTDNNWNQVCHAGLSVAALAIGDKHPEISATIIDRALEFLPLAAKAYAPDGAYKEGPTYWGYGSMYHVVLADALLQATGSTHGTDAYPGFMESAEYLRQVTGPSGAFYNYCDARETRGLQLPLFWMAARHRRPDWANLELDRLDRNLADLHTEYSRLLPLFLFWYDPALTITKPQLPDGLWVGRGSNPVAVFQSPKNSLYFAFKGGSPSDSHAHMDAGSFVLESNNVRWAVDLGLQEYHSLESRGIPLWDRDQKSPRWSVFRLGSESHNILRFDGVPQHVAGRAELATFDREKQFAVFDLTELYPDRVTSVKRGARLVENSILLQDEWHTGNRPVSASWQFLTRATVKQIEDGWILTQEGQALTIRILEPSSFTLGNIAADTLLLPHDAENPGVKRLSITLPSAADTVSRLRVLFTPGRAEKRAKIPAIPLNDWA